MEGIMRRTYTTDRPTDYSVRCSANVYEQLLDNQRAREATEKQDIDRYRELARLIEAKSTYLSTIQESRKDLYRPDATDITERVLGEHLCVIHDMPGWYFYDSSLAYNVVYAIGANGSIYRTTTRYDRDSFICIDAKLSTYPSDELAQFADAIEAYTARDAFAMVDLMTRRMERLKIRGLS